MITNISLIIYELLTINSELFLYHRNELRHNNFVKFAWTKQLEWSGLKSLWNFNVSNQAIEPIIAIQNGNEWNG